MEDCKGEERLCLSHSCDAPDTTFAGCVRARVAREGDALRDTETKALVLLLHAVCGCGAALAAAACLIAGACGAAVFLFGMAAASLAGAAHLCRRRVLWFARGTLCYGLAVTALGVHWALGGGLECGGVAYVGLLGPQLALVTGSGLRQSAALLATVLLGAGAISALQCAVGPGLAPQLVPLTERARLVIFVAGLLVAGGLSCLGLLLRTAQDARERARADALRARLAQTAQTLSTVAAEQRFAHRLICTTFPEAVACSLLELFHTVARTETAPAAAEPPPPTDASASARTLGGRLQTVSRHSVFATGLLARRRHALDPSHAFCSLINPLSAPRPGPGPPNPQCHQVSLCHDRSYVALAGSAFAQRPCGGAYCAPQAPQGKGNWL